MTEATVRAVEALEAMTPRELREQYREVFGETSRSNNRRWLLRRIAWRLQANEEGGLSDRARRRADELARDADVRVRPPADFDMRQRVVTRPISRDRDPRLPIAGTILTRVFKGIEHRVTVLPKGFEYEGRTYRSLSAVAHAISGSHWNGYLFFGLETPRRKGAE